MGNKSTWVDGRVDVLLAALHEFGMSSSRSAAAEFIQRRVQTVAEQMGMSPAAARRYLSDEAVVELARGMAVAVAEESPGADLLEAARTAAVPLPILGRTIAALAEAIQVRLAEREDIDHLRVMVGQLACALSALGQLAAEADLDTSPPHIGRQPVVLIPPALVNRAARYLEATATLIRDHGVLPGNVAAEHATKLADTFLEDAVALRACTAGR